MTEVPPAPMNTSISSNLLRVIPLMESSVQHVTDVADNASLSSDSTCSSCVSSCPSFVKEQEPLGKYRLVKTLGLGEFGKVKLGIHTETYQKVAIKVIKKNTTDSKLAKVQREIQILKSLRHPHIIKLIEVVETNSRIGIILEYASGGELFEYVLSHRSLEEDEAVKLFAQLISSVNHMHLKGIAHRDLKLENLLFLDMEQTQLVVSDFGFANNDKKDLLTTCCGSPSYAAPELVYPSGGYSGPAADIWSCGVILYCMICGYLPFDDDPENPESANLHQLYQYIRSTPLTFPTFVSDEAQDLMRHMLQPDPADRCTLHFVMNHPWLQDYKNTLFAMSNEELEKQALDSIIHLLPPDKVDDDQQQQQQQQEQQQEQQSENSHPYLKYNTISDVLPQELNGHQVQNQRDTHSEIHNEIEDQVENLSMTESHSQDLKQNGQQPQAPDKNNNILEQKADDSQILEPKIAQSQGLDSNGVLPQRLDSNGALPQKLDSNGAFSQRLDQNGTTFQVLDLKYTQSQELDQKGAQSQEPDHLIQNKDSKMPRLDDHLNGEQLQHPMDAMPPTPSSLLDKSQLSTTTETTTSHEAKEKELPSLPPLPAISNEEEDLLNDSATKEHPRQRQPSLRRQKKFHPQSTDAEPMPTVKVKSKVDNIQHHYPDNINSDDNNNDIIGIRPSLLVKDHTHYSPLLPGDLSDKMKSDDLDKDDKKDENNKNVQHMKTASLPLLSHKTDTDLIIDTSTSASKYNSNGNLQEPPKKRHSRLPSILSLSYSGPRPYRSQSTHLPRKQRTDEHEKEKESSFTAAATIPVARKKTMTQTVKAWIIKKKHFMKSHHSSSSSLSTSTSSVATDRGNNYNNQQQQQSRTDHRHRHHHHHVKEDQKHEQIHHYLASSSSPSSLETTTMDRSVMRILSHAQGENLSSMAPGDLMLTLVRILTALGIDVHHESSYQLACTRRSLHHGVSKKNKKGINKDKKTDLTTATIYGPPDLDDGHHVDFTVEICRSLLSDLYVIDIQHSYGNNVTFQFLKSKLLVLLNLN